MIVAAPELEEAIRALVEQRPTIIPAATIADALRGLLDRFEGEYQRLTDGEHGTTAVFPEVRAARHLARRLRPKEGAR